MQIAPKCYHNYINVLFIVVLSMVLNHHKLSYLQKNRDVLKEYSTSMPSLVIEDNIFYGFEVDNEVLLITFDEKITEKTLRELFDYKEFEFIFL